MARSLLAELYHSSRVSAREHECASAEARQRNLKWIQDVDRAAKKEVAARARLERAEAADQKRFEKELKKAHQEARQTESDRLNAELAEREQALETLLQATLDVDDFVDLEALRQPLLHPTFRSEHQDPAPRPAVLQHIPKPELVLPKAPGIFVKLVDPTRHARATEDAKEEHERLVSSWKRGRQKVEKENAKRLEQHAAEEADRRERLGADRAAYDEASFRREVEHQRHDEAVTTLVNNLAYGDPAAVQEYIGIVLANSVYPEHLPVEHDFKHDAAASELSLEVSIPAPEDFDTVKTFRYVKAADEIKPTPLSAKAIRDRYLSVLQQVALRSLHEVFEADRRAVVKTISLQVGTLTNDPKTGNPAFLPFVSVSVEREAFLSLNLANVVPAETLTHLSANTSKDPTKLMTIDPKGVQRS